jgi:hypothetical protein
MLTAASVLSESVLQTKMLTGRYLAGFDDQTARKQETHLPNHVIWNLGHCALTMHRVANMLEGSSELPASEFVAGETVARDRFVVESVAFGSAPSEQAGRYPSFERAKAIYEAACDRLGKVVAKSSDQALMSTVKWGNADTTVYALVLRMSFHNGFHTGQIADLRRAQGMKSIFA